MKKKFKNVLAIDPSTTHLGWAILEYDKNNDECIVVEYGEFKGVQAAKRRKEDMKIYDQKLLTLLEIEQFMSSLLDSHSIDYAVIEDAFYNIRFPTAYASLILVIHTISRLLYTKHKLEKSTLDTLATMYKQAPRAIKNIATGNGNASKQEMMDALINKNDIILAKKIKEVLSEHEIDAILCGYAYIKTNLNLFT